MQDARRTRILGAQCLLGTVKEGGGCEMLASMKFDGQGLLKKAVLQARLLLGCWCTHSQGSGLQLRNASADIALQVIGGILRDGKSGSPDAKTGPLNVRLYLIALEVTSQYWCPYTTHMLLVQES